LAVLTVLLQRLRDGQTGRLLEGQLEFAGGFDVRLDLGDDLQDVGVDEGVFGEDGDLEL
jgi:hypothetical protein